MVCLISLSKLWMSLALNIVGKHLGQCSELNKLYNKALVVLKHFNVDFLHIISFTIHR